MFVGRTFFRVELDRGDQRVKAELARCVNHRPFPLAQQLLQHCEILAENGLSGSHAAVWYQRKRGSAGWLDELPGSPRCLSLARHGQALADTSLARIPTATLQAPMQPHARSTATAMVTFRGMVDVDVDV